MSLRDQVAVLPPTALVPVGWLLEQLDTEPDVPTSVSLVPEDRKSVV